MGYGNPDQLLQTIQHEPLPRNEIGHTPIDDFHHFCAFSGLSEHLVGREAFAWAKVAFVSAWQARHDIGQKYRRQ
jgi:hypothetical protein